MFKKILGAKEPALTSEVMAALRANVMVADKDLNITYINPSLLEMLKQAEAEVQRELPAFKVASLVGSNIDIFHKNPQHQRHMLSSLRKPHVAMIKVGAWMFDLVVTPLLGNNGPTGFVVEWSDAKERLLNLDYGAQLTAIKRSQAVIEFTVDGTIVEANENFLKTLGYRMDEIRGKHHSIFVEESYRATPHYKEFWAKLARGEYVAEQFKRIGKNGKEVWIEASYNPIFDVNGKVAKVVKFATDISAQVKLLGDLKGLIDTNFGEIDQAISHSAQEAGSASSAATEATTNVQAVTEASSQLSESVDEISRSMVKSRQATEAAFDKAAGAEASTAKLTGAAQAMNGIVSLIQNIAGQINLLALNATIEAARAGDAGRGFAVVASEVKNLANQAARATEQISTEIDGIQVTSAEVAGALDAIQGAVNSVRELVTITASAVEEQSAVTRTMSDNMQRASSAVSTMSDNVTGISGSVRNVAAAMAKTREAAKVLVR